MAPCQGLCWCAGIEQQSSSILNGSCIAGNDTAPAEHFALDVGRVTVLGTAPLTQQRTCVAGLPCHIDGITGHGLTDDDKVLVLHTCGNVAHVGGFPGYGAMRFTSASGASVFWASPVTALGGQYRLCWCSSGQHCSSGEQFRTDFGSFTLVGPSGSNQDRTCIAGLSCVVEAIAGQDLSVLNQYAVLDTCGVASPIAGMPSLETTAYNAAVTSVTVTAVAGQYRLCWCSGLLNQAPVGSNSTDNQSNGSGYLSFLPWWNASLVNMSSPSNDTAVPCRTAEEFRMDVGGLLLIGATTSASDFTCVSGRDCELDHIVGISLSDGDSIVVLDTCGRPGAPLQPRALANGTHAAWQTITTPGGVYRLCWCSASKQCHGAEDFDLDIGRLFVLGPRPLSQDRTCVSGMECAVNGIESYGMLQAGSIAILSTCGLVDGTDIWAGLPMSFASQQQPGSSVFSASLVTDVEMTAAGGKYKLCWCGSWAGGCDRSEDFKVDFGNFFLVGVSPLQQDRTCFAGAACVLADISGHGIAAESSVLVLGTCGLGRATLMRSWWDEASISSASGSVTSWPMRPSSGPGGQYRLCWCSRQPCSVRDALVDFGQLTLVGPEPLYQHRTCVSGLTCELNGITGTFWSGDIWVLDTCGTRSGSSRFAMDGRSLISMPEGTVSFNYPVSAAGGQYRICWCSDGFLNHSNSTDDLARRGCTFAQEFVMDIGELLLVGMSPLAQDQTCIAGQSCHLPDLRGFGLSALDTVAVLDTCGQQALQRWPAEPTILETDGKLSVSWSFVTAAGGRYRLCWCPGLSWTSGEAEDDFDPWASNDTWNGSGTPVQSFQRKCSSTVSMIVDFGALTLLGPTPLYQHYTCVSGQTCEIEHVEGLHLQEGDRIQLLETCAVSVQGTVPPRMPAGGLLQAFALGNNSLAFSLGEVDVPISAVGGTYRLCWCSADVDCRALESFRLDIGQLTVLGARSGSFTCVSGRRCHIDGVPGLFASSAFVMLDTCGIGASIDQGQMIQSSGSMSGVSGVLSASGGQYRLCWCGSSEETWIQGANDSNSSVSVLRTLGCATSEDFQIDAGEIHLVGPVLGQARTCIGGQLCRIEGLVGYGLAPSDRLLVMNSCGSISALPAGFPGTGTALVPTNRTVAANISDFWNTIVTAAGGTYRLCWCGELGASCSASQDFSVDVGDFTLLGPRPLEQHRTCISGRACFLAASPDHGLEGLGVDPAADGLLAIPLASTCGTLGVRVIDGTTSYLAMPSGSSPVTVVQAVPRMSEPGGLYRLCWCSSQALSCMAQHHSVQVGLLTVLGPAPLKQDRTCISGTSCMVDLEGSFVDARVAGMLMVLETCGLPSLLPRFLPDGVVPLPGGTEANKSANMSALQISAAGGLYRMCWCANTLPASLLNESLVYDSGLRLEACSEPSDFVVDVAASGGKECLQHRSYRELPICVSGIRGWCLDGCGARSP